MKFFKNVTIFGIITNPFSGLFSLTSIISIRKLIETYEKNLYPSDLEKEIFFKSKKLKRLLIPSFVFRIMPILPFISDFLIGRFWKSDFKKLIYSKEVDKEVNYKTISLDGKNKFVIDNAKKIMKTLHGLCPLNVLILILGAISGVRYDGEFTNENIKITIPLFVVFAIVVIISFYKSSNIIYLINKLADVDKSEIDHPDVLEIVNASKQVKSGMRFKMFGNIGNPLMIFSPFLHVVFLLPQFKKLEFFKKQKKINNIV